MTNQTHIKSELFQFLTDLKANNNRDWFNANKNRYEAELRGPLLQFITDFGVRLPELSPHFVADTRKVGGSLFRIYRDVRFSKDKTPYKTNAGVHFRHEAAKDVHAPGFYLHLEVDGCFGGVGIWHPDNKTLGKIRDAIVEKPDAWTSATTNPAFTEQWQLAGDSLKRPPKGYDRDHPLIVDLKRKDFIAVTSFTQAQICSPGFIDLYSEICKPTLPFMKFLTDAIGVSF